MPVASRAGRCGGRGPPWGRETGPASDCWQAGRRWAPLRGTGRARRLAATHRGPGDWTPLGGPCRRGGRPPTRGDVVRPLPRTYQGHPLAATPPDATLSWEEEGVQLHAQVWGDLVLPTLGVGAPTLTVVALYDPRYRDPWLLATPLPLSPQAVRALYRDRWPVEQLPLVAKQLLGAARQFVHAPQTCQRLPVLALLAGTILAYAAATAPAIPTGFWDRRPRPTAGRLRRALEGYPFPADFPLPARLHPKRVVTAHLPTGFWGQRRRPSALPADAA